MPNVLTIKERSAQSWPLAYVEEWKQNWSLHTLLKELLKQVYMLTYTGTWTSHGTILYPTPPNDKRKKKLCVWNRHLNTMHDIIQKDSVNVSAMTDNTSISKPHDKWSMPRDTEWTNLCGGGLSCLSKALRNAARQRSVLRVNSAHPPPAIRAPNVHICKHTHTHTLSH